MTFKGERRSGTAAGGLLAASVCLLALPSTVLAFTADFTLADHPAPAIARDGGRTPGGLARAIAIRSLAKGKLFLFTPAGTPSRPDRSVTVAVRVDPAAARAIIVHGRQDLAQVDTDLGHLRIAPTAFSLGVSRGYRNFSQDLVAPPARSLAELPEVRKYTLTPGTRQAPSRFSPRISLDEKAVSGRAPRTFAGDAGEVDVGGAYRVTENLNVTAGVRYSQDRERLAPVTDGKQDSQAVYVGTQFSF